MGLLEYFKRMIIKTLLEALQIFERYDDKSTVKSDGGLIFIERAHLPSRMSPVDVNRLHTLGWQWKEDDSEWLYVGA